MGSKRRHSRPRPGTHLVCTYDGNDPYDARSYAVYVNGRPLDLSPTVFLNGAPFGGDTKQNNLGYDSYRSAPAMTPKYFIGSLNELLVYNTVLSAGDVEVLYGGRQGERDAPSRYPGHHVPVVGDNLVAGYHLDEGRGTTVHDFSGHGNDGTFSGGHMGPGRAAISPRPAANISNGLQFDGTGYVSIPGKNFRNLQSGTISVWIRPTAARHHMSSLHDKSSDRQFPVGIHWDHGRRDVFRDLDGE